MKNQASTNSRKKFLIIIVMVLFAAVLFKYRDNIPMLQKWHEMNEKLVFQEKHYLYLKNILNQKERIEKQYRENIKAIENIEKKIFSGENTHIASANLQKIIQNLSEEHGVRISRTSAGKPQEFATGLSLISINVVAESDTMEKLNNYLKAIEYYSNQFLYISRLYLKASNKRIFIEFKIFSIASS